MERRGGIYVRFCCTDHSVVPFGVSMDTGNNFSSYYNM